MSESAKKDGSNLLASFRKKQRAQADPTSSQIPTPQGKLFQSPAQPTTQNAKASVTFSEIKERKIYKETSGESSPLEMVRSALSTLTKLNQDSPTVDSNSQNDIVSMLQGVEEYLERVNTPRRRLSGKFGQASSGKSKKSIGGYSEEGTPFYGSAKKDQRSILMENQLDLNESEIDYYEEVINDLSEKLEKLQEDSKNQENQEIQELLKKVNSLEQDLSSERELRSSLEVQVELLQTKTEEDLQRIQELEGKNAFLAAAQEGFNPADLGFDEFSLKQLQEAAGASDALRERVREMEVEIEDGQQEIESLNELVDDLRNQLDTKNYDSVDPRAEESEEVLFLRSEVEQLRNSISQLKNNKTPVQSAKKPMDALLGFTPGSTSKLDTSMYKSNLSLLKVYMGNQMDLNESETEQFEKMVELIEQEKEKVEAEFKVLKDIHEQCENVQNDLRMELKMKEKDVLQYKNLFESFNQTIIEKDKIIQDLQNEIKEVKSPMKSSKTLNSALFGENEDESALSSPLSFGGFYTEEDRFSGKNPVFPKGFIETPESILTKGDAQELRKIIINHENMIRGQLAQLKTQENSISELKKTISLMEEQKENLQKTLDDQIKTLQKGETTPMTPLTENSFNNSKNPNSASLNSAETPLRQRLNQAESQVDELTSQLRNAIKSYEEVQLQHEKLQVRFQTKVRHSEDQNQEIQFLREELDLKLQDLDRLKMTSMKVEANFKLEMVDKDSEIEIMKSRLDFLESEKTEKDDLLALKENELNDERELTKSLHNMMEKIAEKEGYREKELVELTAFKDQLQIQLNEKTRLLAEKDHKNQEKIKTLENELKNYEKELNERKNEMENQIQMIKNQAENSLNKSQSSTEELNNRITVLMSEKVGIEEALKTANSHIKTLETQLSDKKTTQQQAVHSLEQISEILVYNQTRFHKFEDNLQKEVNKKINSLTNKTNDLMENLEKVRTCGALNVLEDEVEGPFNGLSPEQLRAALLKMEETLEHALTRHEQDEEEIKSLNDQLDNANSEITEMERRLQETLLRMDHPTEEPVKPSISSEEYSRIMQRLSDAEQRAVAMSTDSAKTFANSARAIAFLEGECGRLKTLVDHFRVVNIKLTGDLKNANLDGMRCKSLEHRLRMVSQDEHVLKERLQNVENTLGKKEKELLKVLKSSRENEEKNNETFEKEYNVLNDKLVKSQNDFNHLVKEYEKVKNELNNNDLLVKGDLEKLYEKLKNAENEILRQNEEIEKTETEVSVLKSVIKEKDHQFSQAEMKVSLLQHEMAVVKDTNNHLINELNQDIEEKQNKIKLLENNLSSLKAKVVELEVSFVRRDEDLAQKLLSRAQAEEKTRELRLLMDSQNSSIAGLRAEVEELRDLEEKLKLELEGKEELVQEREIEIMKLTPRVNEAEEKCRVLEEKLEISEENLKNATQLLEETKRSLTDIEHNYSRLEVDFKKIQSEEQLIRTSNEALSEENNYLQLQLDGLVPKLTHAAEEIVELRNSKKDLEGSVAELTQQVQGLSSKNLILKNKLDVYDATEADIAVEIRAFAELINPGTYPSFPSEPTPHSNEYPSGAADLFASPPLAVTRSLLRNEENLVDLTSEQSFSIDPKDLFSNTKGSFNGLCKEVKDLKAVLKGFEGSLEELKREKEGLSRENEVFKQEKHRLKTEKELTEIGLKKVEETVFGLNQKIAVLEEEKEYLLSNYGNISQRMSVVLKDLDNNLLEVLAKTNDSVAGLIPINTDALPNLTISQALISFDEKRLKHERTGLKDSNFVSVLSVSVSEVDRATGYLVGVVDSLVFELTEKTKMYEKVVNQTEGKFSGFEKEKENLIGNIALKDIELSNLKSELSQLHLELDNSTTERERLKTRLNEVSSHQSLIETEIKTQKTKNHELQTTIDQNEGLIMDLKSKIRVFEVEMNKKNEEMAGVNEENESLSKRISSVELQNERVSSALGRVKAEKEALDNVRRSLESELDRCRAELIGFRENSKTQEEENQAGFEVEKLLAALGTTLDQLQVHVPMLQADQSSFLESNQSMTHDHDTPVKSGQPPLTAESLRHYSPNTAASLSELMLGGINGLSLARRVDNSVKRLTRLRAWSREENKSKRVLESTCESLTEELTISQKTVEDLQEQLKEMETKFNENKFELNDKKEENENLINDLQKIRNDLRHFQENFENTSIALEDERNSRQFIEAELQEKESDYSRLQGELEQKNHHIARLQTQLNDVQDQLQEVFNESEQKTQQLKIAKNNSDRIFETLEQMEKGHEKDKNERDFLEKRLLEAESAALSVNRLKTRLAELESSLTLAKEENKNLTKTKVLLEEQNEVFSKDLESSRRKVTSLENRIENILLEKNTFVDEISETRRKIALAKEQVETEKVQRLKSEAAVEALKNISEKNRFIAGNFSAQTEEVVSRQLVSEDEKRGLRMKINELKQLCDEQESLRQIESDDKKKLERDIKQLKIALTKRTQELSVASQYSSTLRSEGRIARKQVLEAISTLKELIYLIGLDAQAAGITLPPTNYDLGSVSGLSDEGHSSDSTLFGEKGLKKLGLSEALGLNDLNRVLENLKPFVGFVRDSPAQRQDLEVSLDVLKTQNENLERELNENNNSWEEACNRYKEELHSARVEITEIRREDSKNPHLTKQISSLESALAQERDRREKALLDVGKLKEKLDELMRGSVMQTHSSFHESAIQEELNSLRAEIDDLRENEKTLQKEIKAISHHRQVLKDTIIHLESELKHKSDKMSEIMSMMEANVIMATFGEPLTREENALQKHVLRYKARASAMEELANVYRTGLLALYADGASYGAAQYGWQPQGFPQEFPEKGVHLIGVGWIEREVNTIKQSYQEEIRLLDLEVSELRGKLRQNNSYILELQQRFEDNMRSIYRSGKGNVSEGYLQQYEQMRVALEQSHLENATLQQDLSAEKVSTRQRLQLLVEELTKTLQARDASLAALKRLEMFCLDQGLDIQGLAIYETMKSELVVTHGQNNKTLSRNDSSLTHHSKPLNKTHIHHSKSDLKGELRTDQSLRDMMKGLIETDHELAEAERRQLHRQHGHLKQTSTSTRVTSRHSVEETISKTTQEKRNSGIPQRKSSNSLQNSSNMPTGSSLGRSSIGSASIRVSKATRSENKEK